MEKIGDLREAQRSIVIEWKIKDYCLLSDEPNECYTSPEFSFCGISWEICICPCGSSIVGLYSWIGLYVRPTDESVKSMLAPIPMTVCIYFINVNGEIDKHCRHTVEFKTEYSYNFDGFVMQSTLNGKKSELLPSGTLTVGCIMVKGDTIFKAGCADVFTQTEEEIGILKLQQHLKEILENGNVSDVVLKVGGQEFKSHRSILARSPVFLAMMTHDTKEKNTGVVEIEDIDPNTLCNVLNYLYIGSREIITPDNAVKLYTVADKYQVDDLKKSCIDYMINNISVDYFCDILSLSLKHVEKELTDACSKFFSENALAIVKSLKWQMFLKENPVASNELYIKQLEKNELKIETE